MDVGNGRRTDCLGLLAAVFVRRIRGVVAMMAVVLVEVTVMMVVVRCVSTRMRVLLAWRNYTANQHAGGENQTCRLFKAR